MVIRGNTFGICRVMQHVGIPRHEVLEPFVDLRIPEYVDRAPEPPSRDTWQGLVNCPGSAL